MEESLKRRLMSLRNGTLVNRLDQIELANDVMIAIAKLERQLFETQRLNQGNQHANQSCS